MSLCRISPYCSKCCCCWIDQLKVFLNLRIDPLEEIFQGPGIGIAKQEHVLLLPNSLVTAKTKLSLDAIKRLFEDHGFRAKLVTSPRAAVSIYMDSCKLPVDLNHSGEFHRSSLYEKENGKAFILAMLGVHPQQKDLEHVYKTCIQSMYVFKLFLFSLRRASPKALKDIHKIDEVNKLIEAYSQRLQGLTKNNPQAVDFTAEATTLISVVCKVDTRFRIDQLRSEYRRLEVLNSTFSNALLQPFLEFHECHIRDVVYQSSPGSQAFDRITIFFHDSLESTQRPSTFIFLPALNELLTEGLDSVVESAMQSFWHYVRKFGYICMPAIQEKMSPHLRAYFKTGLAPNPYAPLSVKAHFEPTLPLSFYLRGSAGIGKSSLVRIIPLALHATLADLADPELLVQFVKQTLNKPISDLDLELTARPNNNDLSLMSIIQSRRMTLAQSKPGLVVVHMEEMPCCCGTGTASLLRDGGGGGGDPNQLHVCQLLSQRFSGRNGDFKEGNEDQPRNSTRRGIGNDASIIVLFTSNYELQEEGEMALKKLSMFSNLVSIDMAFLSGNDRKEFALCFMQQCILDRLAWPHPTINFTLNIDFGGGDTRPLVQRIRMLAYFASTLLQPDTSTPSIKVQQRGDSCIGVEAGSQSIELWVGFMGILFPKVPRVFDARAVEVMNHLEHTDYSQELYQVIECFFTKSLAPAVIVSNNGKLIAGLVEAVARCSDVRCFQSICASECKMMRSLYDSTKTYNLRDDILRQGLGSYCAVELICRNEDAQLCIREMIEDSPSMTAFSSCRSALGKAGLLFGVHVVGTISPQIRSRASLVL